MPDYYLPGTFSEHLCNLTCAFDVSGSVKDKQLTSFRNGIRVLKEELKPEKITLIEWDTDIPALEVLLAEAQRADAVAAEGCEESAECS